ncbi:MAG: RNA methyltransferase, partial [Alphaproteobacteria bacterium]|nr:RNA methyltransferase [Alphaproteobacteria bacterium]
MTEPNNTPTIILVNSQMGENIGASARAMLNCGLVNLRLVSPKQGWPNDRAESMSVGALDAMPPVEVFDSVEEASHDINTL